MKGEELRAIRVEQLEMTRLQLARAIGYTGNDRNDEDRIRRMEHGHITIPLYIARLVWLMMVLRNAIDKVPPAELPYEFEPDGSINWPKWPGYDFVSVPDEG